MNFTTAAIDTIAEGIDPDMEYTREETPSTVHWVINGYHITHDTNEKLVELEIETTEYGYPTFVPIATLHTATTEQREHAAYILGATLTH